MSGVGGYPGPNPGCPPLQVGAVKGSRSVLSEMSVKHMDRYLEELEWRFNNRDNPHIFRDALRRIMHTSPLEYRTLIAD